MRFRHYVKNDNPSSRRGAPAAPHLGDSDRFTLAREGGEFVAFAPWESVLPEVEELASVVVCEDDDATRELLCDHLTADRYRALPAPSASDALRLCAYNHPDLLVLDLGLPDAPGIDVLREIRRAEDRFDPDLPVVVLSGRTTEADRLRGFEAGADDFVPKVRGALSGCPQHPRASRSGRMRPELLIHRPALGPND